MNGQHFSDVENAHTSNRIRHSALARGLRRAKLTGAEFRGLQVVYETLPLSGIAHYTLNRSVIPRLQDDCEEQSLLERNPADDKLAMKRWLSETFFIVHVQGQGIPLMNGQHFIDDQNARNDGFLIVGVSLTNE